MLRITLLTLALMLCGGTAYAQTNVVVFIGDSETSGRGALADLPAGTWTSSCAGCLGRFPTPAFMMLDTQWRLVPAHEPLDDWRGQVQPYGDGQSADNGQPGNGQAAASYAGETVRQLVAALGGDWLAVNCSKGRTTANYWSPQPPGYSGYQMGHYHQRRAAYGVVATEGDVAAIYVYLGINDAKLDADANAYEARMRSLLASLRATFGQGFPIVLVRIHPNHPLQATNVTRWATVRAGVLAVSNDATYEPTYLVDAPNGPYNPAPDMHLSTAGQMTLASRAATAVLESRNVTE
jgi:hypothetical protein